jgi:thioesterase domain-containing protein
MAAHYVAEIRTVQPTGPYRLAGWSLGGVIVIEMARQLRAVGERVAPVILLDAPPLAISAGNRLRRWQRNAIRHYQRWRSHNWVDRGRYITLTAVARVKTLLFEAKFRIGEQAGEVQPAQFDVGQAQMVATRRYQQRRYGGDVVLLRTRSSLAKYGYAATFGWNRFIDGQIEVRDVDGDHLTMLEPPHVVGLVRVLESVLVDD